jgi:hypothetical protein
VGNDFAACVTLLARRSNRAAPHCSKTSHYAIPAFAGTDANAVERLPAHRDRAAR